MQRFAVSLFPETELSAIAALSSKDDAIRTRATEVVARAYRGPIIAVLRHRLGLAEPDAEDLAHDFLAQALSKEWLQRYDPSRARFRTFLRSCLSAYASTSRESQGRLKRGGGAVHVPLELAPDVREPDGEGALFDREWARSVLDMALQALRAECLAQDRESTWLVFLARDVEGTASEVPPSYADLARRFALPATQVTNYLAWARPRFRNHVLDALRSLTTSEAEFRAEARALLGVAIT